MKTFHQKIIKLGFEPFWNTDTTLTFTQSGGYDLRRPHHIVYDKERELYFFRGLGHTIKSFQTLEELELLMTEYIK